MRVDLAVNKAPEHAMHEEPWTGIRHGHGLRTVCGYVVRATWFDGRPHADVFRSTDYGQALEAAIAQRAGAGREGYAVIDSLHACGCRELG